MANISKYQSYKAAWARIRDAINDSYYLEAITICESIISDRLLSFVNGESSKKLTTRSSFYDLTRAAEKLLQENTGESSPQIDVGEIDDWRVLRNKTVHAFVKTLPGESTLEVREFQSMCETVAKQGSRLARSVCTWHRKMLIEKERKMRKST